MKLKIPLYYKQLILVVPTLNYLSPLITTPHLYIKYQKKIYYIPYMARLE